MDNVNDENEAQDHKSIEKMDWFHFESAPFFTISVSSTERWNWDISGCSWTSALIGHQIELGGTHLHVSSEFSGT
jgi:hypothetical protein